MDASANHLAWPPLMHPLDQAAWWSRGVTLYPWQRDVLNEAAKPRSRVACSTSNESGKSSTIIPVFAMSAMMAFPGCYVFITSGSLDQVREQIFATNLEPIVSELPGWEISTTKGNLHVTSPVLRGKARSRLIGYKCSAGGRAEGFHGKWDQDKTGRRYYRPCVYIIDEAKTVDDPLFEAVLRIDPDFLLALSTPGQMSGWFYRAIDPNTLEAQESSMDISEASADAVLRRIQEVEARLKELNA